MSAGESTETTALLNRSSPNADHMPVDTTDHSPGAGLIDTDFLLATFLDTTPDLVYFKDTESRFTLTGCAFAQRMGLACSEDAVGRTDFDFFAYDHAAEAFADEQRIMSTGVPMIGQEEREGWPDGTVTWVSTTKVPLFDRAGKVMGIFGMSRDVTQRRAAAEQLAAQTLQLAEQAAQLEQLTLGDELTGLHNRRGLRLLGGAAVDRAHRDSEPLCVLFLDLDGLKAINDGLGHGAGDRILTEAADVLRSTTRAADIVARIGGDEFAVVAINTTPDDAARLAGRVRKAAQARPSVEGCLSLSVGIASLTPGAEQTIDDLLDVADRAMYEDKRRCDPSAGLS
jgi:diguanylate cyclase (GGDEF)-like protein/PAS domain S-box-containing protein